MTMLLLVFRHSLDEEILQLLKEMDVKSFTEAPKVFGMGEAGTAFSSMAWPGSNCMILAAMEDEQATRVVARLRDFRDRLSKQQSKNKIPIRVFSLPCERLI
jgi:hypothetical protein